MSKEKDRRIAELEGLTLRDYFAAHAPASPQPWFRPEMPPQPERIYPHKKCMNACCKLPMNASEREAWVLEKERQLYIQWPYAWADAMLAERDRAKGGGDE